LPNSFLYVQHSRHTIAPLCYTLGSTFLDAKHRRSITLSSSSLQPVWEVFGHRTFHTKAHHHSPSPSPIYISVLTEVEDTVHPTWCNNAPSRHQSFNIMQSTAPKESLHGVEAMVGVTDRRALAPADYMTWFSLTLIKGRYRKRSRGSSRLHEMTRIDQRTV